MKKLSKERIDRLFKHGYGLLRFGKISFVKGYKYKLSLPRIYIEEKSVTGKGLM